MREQCNKCFLEKENHSKVRFPVRLLTRVVVCGGLDEGNKTTTIAGDPRGRYSSRSKV